MGAAKSWPELRRYFAREWGELELDRLGESISSTTTWWPVFIHCKQEGVFYGDRHPSRSSLGSLLLYPEEDGSHGEP